MGAGDVCHIEFSTNDLAASRKFFEEIFGWTFQILPGMEGYALFSTPDGVGGGLNGGERAEAPTDKGPIVHLEVDDIETTLAKIVDKGGTLVLPKTKISDEFGFYAVFLDNVGNRFGLYSR